MIFNPKVLVLALFAAVSLPFAVNGNEEDRFSEHIILGRNEKKIDGMSSSSIAAAMSLPMSKISKKQKTNQRSLVGDPPFEGTVFVDENIITDSDPNSLQRVDMYDETRCGMFQDCLGRSWISYLIFLTVF